MVVEVVLASIVVIIIEPDVVVVPVWVRKIRAVGGQFGLGVFQAEARNIVRHFHGTSWELDR